MISSKLKASRAILAGVCALAIVALSSCVMPPPRRQEPPPPPPPREGPDNRGRGRGKHGPRSFTEDGVLEISADMVVSVEEIAQAPRPAPRPAPPPAPRPDPRRPGPGPSPRVTADAYVEIPLNV